MDLSVIITEILRHIEAFGTDLKIQKNQFKK